MTSTELSARSTSSSSPRHPGAAPALVGATVNAVSRVAPRAAGRLALELWRRPGRPADVRPEERIVHDAACRSVVEVAGTGVAAYAWGDAPRPVLLVHGWGARASRFGGLVTALLESGHSAVAYDAWGHGASPGPVRTILEHRTVIAELEERHGPFGGVVGHSFGVPVAPVRRSLGARCRPGGGGERHERVRLSRRLVLRAARPARPRRPRAETSDRARLLRG